MLQPDTFSWRVNGRVRGALEGCDDVDLAITPATNTLPIRRLDPGVGAEVAARVAWVRFPSLAVEPALQHYRNLGGGRFRYERRAGPVRAELEVDARGLVTRYGDSWERVARPEPGGQRQNSGRRKRS